MSFTKTSLRYLYAFGVVIVLMLTINLFCFFKEKHDERRSDMEVNSRFIQSYNVYPIEIPDTISFAGEQIPLDLFDIREAVDREMTINVYWQANTLLLLKRSSRYFPTIEKILAKNGIPPDFKYIPLVESGLTTAVSPAGAAGLWHFMEKTGKQYKMEINSEVDERYNLEICTEAACQYLLNAYKKLGCWTFVAAAFNGGEGRIVKQLKRQHVSTLFDLTLNEETARYLYRLIAMKLIFENPDKYGFHLRDKDYYPPIATYNVKVDTAIRNIALFAQEFDVNYKLLKIVNPWLRENFLLNKSKKTYTIKIPEKTFRNCKLTNSEYLIDTARLKQDLIDGKDSSDMQ